MNLNLSARGKFILSLILILVVCVAGYFAYQYLHPAQLVTGESQEQAETPAGISLAVHNAKVGLMQDQIDQASKQIALLKNLPPSIIVKTVPVEVEKVVTQYVKTSGADFAIVTDPANSTKQVDLKAVSALPATTNISLNQYNVFAYKKIIRDVTVYPSFNGITPNGINEVDIGVSRKITNSGVYLGAVAGYDFESRKIKAGLRVMY